MMYRITHKTVYDYSEPALNCQNKVHLTPRDLPYQRRHRHALNIRPTPESMSPFTDFFGNAAVSFNIDQPHDMLVIQSVSRIEVLDRPTPPLGDSLPWEEAAKIIAKADSPECIDAYQYVFPSRYAYRNDKLAAFGRVSFTPGRPLLQGAMDLTKRIHREFKYAPKATSLTTSIDEILEAHHGVCQDFAHLQIGVMRSLGLAARYVSGYLRTDPPPGKPRLVGADASHAWVDVFCPKFGWVSLDPTNACLASDRHIVLAWGRDYGDVSPIKGVALGGGEHELTVTVDAVPI
ncbi:MAG: transglutaminase family protein [Planctomycetes bacterium]|nr:transglutaminase family protein [Planctomycetota bacterium]